jgi:hypothetical protein
MARWKQGLAGLMALLMGANGVVMLAAPLGWFDAVPGVPATGPFNAHFVRDVGAVYLMCALALGWYARRPVQAWPALAMAAVWLTLHSAIHVYDAACGASPLADLWRDSAGVHLFAAIPLALAILGAPARLATAHKD